MTEQHNQATQPVYTEATECQDCFKCVRHCPVKAIRIEDGRATVMAEECVACGECYTVCPMGAKRVRDDVGRAQELLDSGRRVVVSLAPSYVAEFTEMSTARLIHAIKQLGVETVSETALGAQEVSANVAQIFRDKPEPQLYISSACPTAVEVLRKYYPQLGRYVTDFCSPVLAHCRILRQCYGQDTAVIFVGPCIGKKREADRHPDMLDLALTYDELRNLLDLRNIETHQAEVDPEQDYFLPAEAEEGALYPVDGGMIAGIKANCSVSEAQFMSESGIRSIPDALEGLDPENLEKPVFLELLACKGGCINGPVMAADQGTVAKRMAVINGTTYEEAKIPRTPAVDVYITDTEEEVKAPAFTEQQIQDALRQVGKTRPEDELNCGGCGYDNCRAFASALLQGKAETSMCVSYMRQLAQKKANALINTMPSGVVMVDADRKIVECNERFATLIGEEAKSIYNAYPGMEGALLRRVVPFYTLFDNVLATGKAPLERDIKHEGRILHVTIFNIETHQLIGAIVQDVTEPNVRKEEVIERARDVIRRNLETVQQVASLLGENAAESEVVLNSIIESFSPELEHEDSKDIADDTGQQKQLEEDS